MENTTREEAPHRLTTEHNTRGWLPEGHHGAENVFCGMRLINSGSIRRSGEVAYFRITAVDERKRYCFGRPVAACVFGTTRTIEVKRSDVAKGSAGKVSVDGSL